jgi:hypothetical protein
MMADWAALRTAATEAARSFATDIADPGRCQRQLLARILAENRDCEFGRRHDFAGIADFEAWCDRVPVRDHGGFTQDIERIAAGHASVLTAAPVIAFEETGGTAMGAKLVPYTAAGLLGFRGAVLPWLGELLRRRPRLTAGRAYVTISPATRAPRTTAGGTPIGLVSDAAYLGADLAPSFAALLAVPPSVATIADPAEWQLQSLTALVGAQDLSFISLWSPTFLIALLAALAPNAEAVLAKLDPTARARLERALSAPALDTGLLWPTLDCISCWKDGASAGYAQQLAQLFPHCVIEGKGLLATEAAVTVPWTAEGDCVPALASCLIEFHDALGNARLCDALQAGCTYRIVVTTASGLYRYDLDDVVECTGHAGAAPILRFVGRSGLVSDLVGEKLDDSFVAAAVAGLRAPALLAARADPPGYVLVLEFPCGSDTVDRVEAGLMRNPQYAYARKIGQLAPIQVIVHAQLSVELARQGLAKGRRLGDLKPVALVPAGASEKDWLQS